MFLMNQETSDKFNHFTSYVQVKLFLALKSLADLSYFISFSRFASFHYFLIYLIFVKHFH